MNPDSHGPHVYVPLTLPVVHTLRGSHGLEAQPSMNVVVVDVVVVEVVVVEVVVVEVVVVVVVVDGGMSTQPLEMKMHRFELALH